MTTESRPLYEEVLGALKDFLEAQDALDNHELIGVNAEDYFIVLRRRNAARKDLDSAIAKLEAALPLQPLIDEVAEDLINESGGHWKEDVFCIGGPELMDLLRSAASASPVSLPLQEGEARDAASINDAWNKVREEARAIAGIARGLGELLAAVEAYGTACAIDARLSKEKETFHA
jgi:tetratricopeptide (TPR) repeat protein